MLRKTYFSKGTNNFRHNEFNNCEWSAPIIVAPNEMKKRIDSMSLIGRKIFDIRIFGHCFNLTRDWIEEVAYTHYEDLIEEERQAKSDYDNIYDELPYKRWVKIDTPILIRFEDGEHLEVDIPQVPELRISMNCIPFWINDDGSNVISKKFFAPNIGGTIIDVQLNTYLTDKDPMLHTPFDEYGTKQELFKDLTIILDNNTRLIISGCVDYTHVQCCDENDEEILITFKELKEALCNWEDIHENEEMNYRAYSRCIFTGEKGFESVNTPHFSIGVENKDSMLAIAVEDMVEIMLAYETIKLDYLDEYDDTLFTYKEWLELLHRAKKLIKMESFDEMFSYILECIGQNDIRINVLHLMNNCCEEIWDHKNKYLFLVEDLERWTEMFVKVTDNVMLYGY